MFYYYTNGLVFRAIFSYIYMNYGTYLIEKYHNTVIELILVSRQFNLNYLYNLMLINYEMKRKMNS